MLEKFSFLRSRLSQSVTLVLVLQASMVSILAPAERVPLTRRLSEIPRSLGGWNLRQESAIDPEIQELLKADETLSRTYTSPEGAYANLFVAFFKSQRAGAAPHSPKVCLPGSGWTPTESNTIEIALAGRADPIRVNRYIVAKGEERDLVLYWYQTPYRVIAGELTAKYYTILDGLRYHRSDTAMVRVIVPVHGSEPEAEAQAVRFIQGAFRPLREFLPL
jgi:EpsI family protein